MATEVIKTIKPSGGDYTSLSAWEAAQNGDLTGVRDEIAIAECYSMSDTTGLTIDGWTTDSTRYIKIYTPTAERHDGKWNTGKYRLEPASGTPLIIYEDYVRIEGLQICLTASADGQACIVANWQNASNDIRINNCILKGSLGSYYGFGIQTESTNTKLKEWNNIIYDFSPTWSCGVYAHAFSTIDSYNSTTYNCYYGFSNAGSGTYTAKNCGAASNGSAGFNGTISQTTCSTSSPTFVNAGSRDLHLASGDTTWKDVGTSDPGAGLFSDDIDGQTRSGSWDIGADEYVATGGTAIPVFMNQYRQRWA